MPPETHPFVDPALVHPAIQSPPSERPEPITHAEVLEYVQKHFFFGADQRLKIFNYYVIVLVGGVGASLTAVKDPNWQTIAVIGFFHIIVALVFTLIEQRNISLINVSRSGLMALENDPYIAQAARVVSIDHDRRRSKEPKSGWKAIAIRKWQGVCSYKHAFTLTYVAEMIFGLSFLVGAGYLYKLPQSQRPVHGISLPSAPSSLPALPKRADKLQAPKKVSPKAPKTPKIKTHKDPPWI